MTGGTYLLGEGRGLQWCVIAYDSQELMNGEKL